MLGYLLAGGALLSFTTTVLAIKAASNRMSLNLGFLVTLLVNVLFAASALGVQLLLRDARLQWNVRAFWLFVAAGVFATYLGRWFFYESVARFGPAKASVFQVSSPLFAALIAWLVLGERLSIWVALGMVMAIAGLALLGYKPSATSQPVMAKDQTATGFLAPVLRSVFLLGLCSSAAYAVANVLRGVGIRSWPEPIAGALIGALTGLAIQMVLTKDRSTLWSSLRAANRSGVGFYALVGIANISGQMFTIASMRFIPVSVATLVSLCTPLLVFPVSYWLFKHQERLTLPVVMGSVLTLLGIALIVMR